MNLSFNEEVTAEAESDRPDATEEALLHRRRIGWREGSPLVEPLDFDGVQLGESLNDSYAHYHRHDGLFMPPSGDFLRRLFEQSEIGSVSDAAKELREDKSDVEKAINLHGIDVESLESDVDPSPDHSEIRLPNGERIDVDDLREPVYTDSRLLHSLLGSYGMSTKEVGLFLSEQVGAGSRITERDVRQAAESVHLL